MTQEPQPHKATPLISGAAIFAAIQAMAAFGLYGTTLAPGYRGGAFLQVLLIVLGVLSVLATAAEIATAIRKEKPKIAALANADAESAVGLPALTAIVCGVVAVIAVTGLYLGPAMLLFGYWVAVVGVRPIKALILAILFGTAMPILFSGLIGTRLWPGAMPTIVRHYLGGGTLPPL